MKFALILVIATLTLVSGHVSITPNQIPSVGSTILNFQLSHGCNASTLTNKVVVMFPTNITSIKPIDKVGWRLNRTVEFMDYRTSAGTPAFYYNFTWEVDPTLYQGLPDWAFDVVQVRVSMTAGAVPNGSKFSIPVWQYCTMGLSYAWISGSAAASEGHAAAPGANGVTVSTAPSFSVLNPTDIQFIPSQANVKFLSDQVTNLTTAVQALTGTNGGTSAPTTTTPTPVVNAGANTINYFEDSSSWRKADTVAVISIILAALSVIASIALTLKLTALKKQSAQHTSKV